MAARSSGARMARIVKWCLLGLLVVAVTFGGISAYRRFGHWFRPSVPTDIIDVIDDSGRVDGDIADLGAGLEDIAGGVSGIEGRSDRIESGVDRLRAHREEFAGGVEGIESGLDKVEAGLDISESAKDQLADLIRRLQGPDPQ